MDYLELISVAEEVVTTLIAGLPPEIRPLAEKVPIHYAALPDQPVLDEGFSEGILGLFTGNPHGTEFSQADPAPPQIILYLENLWDYADGSSEEFCEEVRQTYLHELGHYLGWDEDDLEARGLD